MKHKTLMEDYNFFKFFLWMINFTQQFWVLEVIIATKPPGLRLKPTPLCVIHAHTIRPWLQMAPLLFTIKLVWLVFLQNLTFNGAACKPNCYTCNVGMTKAFEFNSSQKLKKNGWKHCGLDYVLLQNGGFSSGCVTKRCVSQFLNDWRLNK